MQELLKQLRRELLAKEMHMVDVLSELLRSFDRNYSELVEQNKQMIMQFFTNTRDLEGTFNSTLVQLGQKLYEEKYNVEVRMEFLAQYWTGFIIGGTLLPADRHAGRR